MTPSVLVVGGGMVGLAFGLAVKHALPTASVRVLEARALPTDDVSPNPLDTRASALNLASAAILKRYHVADQVLPLGAPIRRIHVSNQHRFGSTLMSAEELGEPCLGWVVDNHLIGRGLKSAADQQGVVVQAPCDVVRLVPGSTPAVQLGDGSHLSADLVIVADGAHSSFREQLGIAADARDVQQVALVANCLFEGTQQGTAFERFTPNGPLALLPLPHAAATQQRFNLVWSMTPDQADHYTDCDDGELMSALQQAFGWRLGAVLDMGVRSRWSLLRIRAREQVRQGFLVAGNAAHGLHPVAGQGLNLSLRDSLALAATLSESMARGEPLGSVTTLRRYEQAVEADQTNTMAATDTLATLFSPLAWGLNTPRDMALAGLDLLPPLRRWVARQGTAADRRLAQVSVMPTPGNPTSGNRTSGNRTLGKMPPELSL